MNSWDCIMVSDERKYWCLHFKGSLEVALSCMEDRGSQPGRLDCNSKNRTHPSCRIQVGSVFQSITQSASFKEKEARRSGFKKP